jgi:uncharacterized protein
MNRLIVFGRYPEPGRTKTRLIPMLGAAGAAELQRRLTEKTVSTAREFASARDVELELCFAGAGTKSVRRWLGPAGELARQAGGDLGSRMQTAFDRAFRQGCSRVVLVGTDIPGLETGFLEKAFNFLDKNHAVIGPSTDGGYWLIGLKGPADIFRGPEWGREAVLEQTLAIAGERGLSVHCLESLTDVDTEDDVRHLLPEWTRPVPYVSVIIPALNEEENVARAVGSALDEDAEVIVVDGGSSDNTVERAVSAGARVETSGRGRALQQNAGAAVSRGRVLLFLHADTILPAGYVARVFETLLDRDAVLGAFRFRTDMNKPLMKAIEFGANLRSSWLGLPYGDQGLFLKRSLFRAMGGFSETPVAEDLLLVRRFSRQGRIRIAAADAVTSSRRWRSVGRLRTLLINQAILVGLVLGISPSTLAGLYRRRGGWGDKNSLFGTGVQVERHRGQEKTTSRARQKNGG